MGINAERIIDVSVPFQKFLITFGLDIDGPAAESFDTGENVVGGLCPSKGPGISIAVVDVGSDRRLQILG